MKVLGVEDGQVTVYNDNQSSISMSANATNQNRTKHIDLRYHFFFSLGEVFQVFKSEQKFSNTLYIDVDVVINIIVNDIIL